MIVSVILITGNMSLPPCCLSGELREQWELNKAIEQELKAQKKADKNEHKLLLLGWLSNFLNYS